MSGETQSKDRSPRAPGITLESALDLAGKLYLQIRGTAVPPESAVKALGYSGLNGSALSALGSLSQYGLIDRPKSKVAITQLAIKALHPVGEAQKIQAVREAALTPKVFTDALQGFDDCGIEIIKSQLIQSGFTPDRARKVADVFIENREFAKLDRPSIVSDDSRTDDTQDEERGGDGGIEKQQETRIKAPSVTAIPALPTDQKMLAQYSIPLGGNSAQLIFSGEELLPDDFDALIEYVELFKRQFERKLARTPKSAVLDSDQVQPPLKIALDFADGTNQPPFNTP